MISLIEKQIEIALPKVEIGLNKYYWIQQNLHSQNISTNLEFQRNFNGFYRIRRNSEWRKHYFDLLEKAKESEITFEKVLEKIYADTGRLEASFASKLVATINPDLPVIDRFVLNNTGLKLPYYSSLERKRKIIRVYDDLIANFVDFLESSTGDFLIKRFKEMYPLHNITSTKIVDLVLWQTR